MEIWRIDIDKQGDVTFFFRYSSGRENEVPWSAVEFEKGSKVRTTLEYIESHLAVAELSLRPTC